MTEATEQDRTWAQTCANEMNCKMFVIIRPNGQPDVVDERDVDDDTVVIFQAAPPGG